MLRLREPKAFDAGPLAAVHVRSWQQAYRGLMPEEYLDGLSVEDRTEMWMGWLQRPPRPRSRRLVAEDHGDVVGFIVVGPAGGDDQTDTGEVFSLNVDPASWRRGIGRALLEAGVETLRDFGFREAVLWVHPGNDRARRFYEAAGWQDDHAERRQDILGVEISEIRYRLGPLEGRC
jgi:ribosomal protein S18 acetylase RimI-like enzyme